MVVRESRIKTAMEMERVMAIIDMGFRGWRVGEVIAAVVVADRSFGELPCSIFLALRSFDEAKHYHTPCQCKETPNKSPLSHHLPELTSNERNWILKPVTPRSTSQHLLT